MRNLFLLISCCLFFQFQLFSQISDSKSLIISSASFSTGINANLSYSRRISKDGFLGAGMSYNLIRMMGPSTFKQYGGHVTANYYPFAIRRHWNFIINPEIQYFHFVNFPGEPYDIRPAQSKHFESIVISVQSKISLQLYRGFGYYFGLGPGYIKSWSPEIRHFYYSPLFTGFGVVVSTGFLIAF